MILGTATTLFLIRKNGTRRPFANRPLAPARQRPLAGAGLVLAVLSRARGPAPATRDIVSVNAALLLIAALLCAVTGAITTTRQQRRGGA